MPRVSHQLTVPKQAEFCDVTPEAAAIRLYEQQDSPPEKQHLKISVLCLRWSHSCINSKMMFGQGGIDGESIFKLFDFLQREKKMPGMQRRGRCRYSSLVLLWMAYRPSYSGRCYRETSFGLETILGTWVAGA